MQRIIWIVFRMFFPIIGLLFQLNWYSREKHRNYEKAYDLVSKACHKVMKVARITPIYEGVENVPKEDGFIFYPNHQGLFDVLLFLDSSPKRFAFVIKKESSNIILLKQIIASIGSLVIDRKDLKQSFALIKEMTKQVKEGRNFIIFAEGTRSRKGNEMLPMKGGSFKAAINAKCPIVPCALIDSYRAFDEKGIARKTVRLIYLPPILYEEYKDMKSQEIADEVKQRIEATIQNVENTTL